jgi:hypothetical protein
VSAEQSLKERTLLRTPERIPAGAIHEPGSHLGKLTSKRTRLCTPVRTRTGCLGMLSRRCVRRMFNTVVIPSAPHLLSIDSAPIQGLFADFIATTPKSEFSYPCIIGFGAPPSRYGPHANRLPGQAGGLPVPGQSAYQHARFWRPRRACRCSR